jgi:hypothetical protein
MASQRKSHADTPEVQVKTFQKWVNDSTDTKVVNGGSKSVAKAASGVVGSSGGVAMVAPRVLKPCTADERAFLMKAGFLATKDAAANEEFVGKQVPRALNRFEILRDYGSKLASDEFYTGIVRRARENEGAMSDEDTTRLLNWYHQRVQQPILTENWFNNPKHADFLQDPFVASLRAQFEEKGYLSPKQFAILSRWKPKHATSTTTTPTVGLKTTCL